MGGDDISGQPLDSRLVEKAKQEEVAYMEGIPVWRHLEEEDAPTDSIYVDTKWVLTDKGADGKVDVRARLVAREIKGHQRSEPELFTATPPLDALRCMISLAATDKNMYLDFIDVRKARLNGIPKRNVVITLPPEAGGGTALLLRTLYGTRDAATAWEACIAKLMQGLGFECGKASSCIYVHKAKRIVVLVHGDDFVTLARWLDVQWLRNCLSQAWDLKIRGALGRETSSIRILGRMLSMDETGYQLEGEQRHAELMTQALGLNETSKPLTTPGSKNMQEGEPLEAAQTSLFRSVVMRAAYYGSDRPDILYTVKELSRRMSSPTTADMERLKRLCRFVLGKPRLIQQFRWQRLPDYLHVERDSDYGGCPCHANPLQDW